MADMNLLNQILAEVLTCACEVLDEGIGGEVGSNCGCPCRAFVTIGTPVWDIEACCSDGQLAVYVRNIYPFNNFPGRDSQVNVCAPVLAADISVQLLRCWPTMDEDGRAPTGPEIQAASEQLYRDMFLLTWGLLCCLKRTARKRKFVLSNTRAVGPQGGCAGVEVDFTIELIDI